MASTYATTGCLRSCRLAVPVSSPSPYAMLCHAWLGASHPFGIMTCGTSLLRHVAHNVFVVPHLQPVPGEQFRHRSAITADQARLDVAASGIWGVRFENTFIDVRVLAPLRLQVVPPHLPPPRPGRRRKSAASMREESLILSTRLSSWLFSQLLVEWVINAQPYTRG